MTTAVREYSVRGVCDQCDADNPIGVYPYWQGGGEQAKGVAGRMVDLWNKAHREATGHTEGHIEIVGTPDSNYDTGSREKVRPTASGEEGH
jgi:hypothetical protein